MKTKTILAKELHAGDDLIVKEGTIRKSHSICELHVIGADVTAIYITKSGFDGLVFKTSDRVKIKDYD